MSNFVVFLCVSVLEFNDAWIYSRYCIGAPPIDVVLNVIFTERGLYEKAIIMGSA